MYSLWTPFTDQKPPTGNLQVFVDGDFIHAYREGEAVYDWSGNVIIVLDDIAANLSDCWWKE